MCDIGSRSKGYQAIPDTISERDDLPNSKIGRYVVGQITSIHLVAC